MNVELPELEPWQIPGWTDREALREHAGTVQQWLGNTLPNGPMADEPLVLILRPVEHVDGTRNAYYKHAIYTRCTLVSWQWAWPRADGESWLVSWCALDEATGAVVAVGPSRVRRKSDMYW